MNVNLDAVSIGTFATVYAAGIVTSLTPCVYPILPIVVGYLGSRKGSPASRLAACVAYATGLALVYSGLGIAAALSGKLFGSLSANNWVYLAFGVLMLYLGGSMMDWYYIPVPNLPGRASDDARMPTILGSFAMGVTSGFVASPCTAPVLGSLLLFVAMKKAVLTGFLLMFTFSMGMGTMLLAIGFFAGSLLPRSGEWMVTVKKALALLIIAGGVYFIYTAGTLG